MISLILLIIILIILWPLIKFFWSVFSQARRINRFMKDPMSAFSGGTAQDNDAQRRNTHTQPRRHKKKIGRDVGEYVDYVELDPTEASASVSGDNVKYRTEEQVSDIKWTDI